MTIWLAFPLSYLLGSIPTAIWVSRIFGRIDIRQHGSRNAGLTNVYRVLGWKPALPVALVDLTKGMAAVWLGRWASGGNETIALACGLMAILGHTFTLFAGFRGGKGVLTALGVFVAISPIPALVAFTVWIAVLRWKGYVSLASIVASVVLGLGNTLLVGLHGLDYAAQARNDAGVDWCSVLGQLVRRGDTALLILSWLAAIFVIYKHRANIERLRRGTENRFGKRPSAAQDFQEKAVARRRAEAQAAGLDPDSVAILGAGSWGLAIARVLADKGLKVTLWEFNAEQAEKLRATRELPDKLPGVRISDEIAITSDLAEAVLNASVVAFIVPSHTMRSTCRGVAAALTAEQAASRRFISMVKGIEEKTLRRMSEIILEAVPGATPRNTAVLSGPSHAEEVATGIPTTVVVASSDEENAAALQDLFFLAPSFRTYRSTDILGVELCGAIKNVIAIASGILDGLQLGDNTRGALLTRGMVEMARLGEKMGGKRDSFYGLAGMGDLITTCTSRHSRNRHVGEEVGRGHRLSEVLAGMKMVAEGVRTVHGTRELAKLHGVEMPLTEQVHAILFEDKPAREAVDALMARAARPEAD